MEGFGRARDHAGDRMAQGMNRTAGDAYANAPTIAGADGYPPRWAAAAAAFRAGLGARARCDLTYGAGARQRFDLLGLPIGHLHKVDAHTVAQILEPVADRQRLGELVHLAGQTYQLDR